MSAISAINKYQLEAEISPEVISFGVGGMSFMYKLQPWYGVSSYTT